MVMLLLLIALLYWLRFIREARCVANVIDISVDKARVRQRVSDLEAPTVVQCQSQTLRASANAPTAHVPDVPQDTQHKDSQQPRTVNIATHLPTPARAPCSFRPPELELND